MGVSPTSPTRLRESAIVAKPNSEGGSSPTTTTPQPFLSGDTPRILAGWFVAYMVLLIAAESSPSLATLAVAFAWLIAVGAIYAAGPDLWATLSKMIDAGSFTNG